MVRRLPWTDPTVMSPEVACRRSRRRRRAAVAREGRGRLLIGWSPVTYPMRGPVARPLGTGRTRGRRPRGRAGRRGRQPRRDAHAQLDPDGRDASSAASRRRVGRPVAGPGRSPGSRDGIHRVAVRSVGPEGWVELGEGALAAWRVEAAPPDTRSPRCRTRAALGELHVHGGRGGDVRVPVGRRSVAHVPRYSGAGALAPRRPARVRGPRDRRLRPARGAPGAARVDDRHAFAGDHDPQRAARRHGEPWACTSSASDDPGATFECLSRVAALGAVPVGRARAEPHAASLDVRARDASGRVDASPAEWRWDFRPIRRRRLARAPRASARRAAVLSTRARATRSSAVSTTRRGSAATDRADARSPRRATASRRARSTTRAHRSRART